jgi:peptidyl-prolyl cis-trans isomerase B (cyclophilin B)
MMNPIPSFTLTPYRNRMGRCRLWRLPLALALALAAFGGPFWSATATARASEAVLHLQVGDAQEDQMVVIALFDKDAPVTVENFRKLAADKFYKGISSHRIVPETLVQFGDPLSRKKDRSSVGTGGPGYTLPAEIRRKHVRGAVAMAALPPALNPARASNGSQFYIALRPLPELDKDYTVFGQVTSGLELLDSISRRGRDTNDYPLERVLIRSIELR